MNQHAGPEDYQLDNWYQPLANKTLEDIIIAGESDWEKDQAQTRITLNCAPQWLISVLISLRRKHKNVPSTAAVERLVTKLGIAVVREQYGDFVQKVDELRNSIFRLGNHVSLTRLYRDRFQLEETVGTVYRQCSCREWVAGAISDSLADSLGFSLSVATQLTLVAGISKSSSWVPRSWVSVAEKELNHFAIYLSNEIKRLEDVLETFR